jgi:hypothetical protein
MIHGNDCVPINGMNEWQEAEVLREELPQCRSVHHRPYMTVSVLELGPPGVSIIALAVLVLPLLAFSLHLYH